MNRWSDWAAWTGDGLRREVFFFDSGGTALYGSLYAADEPSRPFGLVACGSWGVEADRSDPLVRSVAIAMARLGGAAMVFHYPGYGDSYGDLASADLSDLAQTARDAVAEASRRRPGLTWVMAGFMFGASVASLARPEATAGPLLLVQPALRPTAYFERLVEGRRALPLPSRRAKEMLEVGGTSGMAYGYPLPRRMLDPAAGSDAAVEAALAGVDGDAAVVRYAKPAEDGSIPERFERVEAPGAWRFGATLDRELVAAASGWLEQRTGGGDR